MVILQWNNYQDLGCRSKKSCVTYFYVCPYLELVSAICLFNARFEPA